MRVKPMDSHFPNFTSTSTLSRNPFLLSSGGLWGVLRVVITFFCPIISGASGYFAPLGRPIRVWSEMVPTCKISMRGLFALCAPSPMPYNAGLCLATLCFLMCGDVERFRRGVVCLLHPGFSILPYPVFPYVWVRHHVCLLISFKVHT